MEHGNVNNPNANVFQHPIYCISSHLCSYSLLVSISLCTVKNQVKMTFSGSCAVKKENRAQFTCIIIKKFFVFVFFTVV